PGNVWAVGEYSSASAFRTLIERYYDPCVPTDTPRPTATPCPLCPTSTPTGTPTIQGTATPTSTPTHAPCVTVTGSTPRCTFPNTYRYYFGLYNSCGYTVGGPGVVSLEVAASSGGPWTIFDQQSVTIGLAPGSGSV